MKTTFIEHAMRNNKIVITIVLTLMVVGIVALKKMPRNEFPVFTVRQGLVVGVYPGASSEQVAEQLTTAVENYTFGFKEVKKSGVEFVYIRVGRGDGIGKDYVLDDKFVEYIKGFNKVKIPVGVYFYSDANNEEASKK